MGLSEESDPISKPRAMDVLVFLAQHAGQTVARQDILDAVWGDTAVVDGALSRAVHALRAALDDDARHPQYIQTVSRRGYRLVANVVVSDAEAKTQTETASAGENITKTARRKWTNVVAAALGVVLVAALSVAILSRDSRSGDSAQDQVPP